MNPLTWMSERRTRGRIGMITGLCLATATATAQAPGNDNVEAVIDFHNLVEGQIIDSVEVGRGITADRPIPGEVGVFCESKRESTQGNSAAAFDATCDGSPENCSGNDEDLYFPNQNFIQICDVNGDQNGDGFVDGANGPDDELLGAINNYDFSSFGLNDGLVRIRELKLFDVNPDESRNNIVLYRGGVEVARLNLPITGESEKERIVQIPEELTDFTRLELFGSGAVDDIALKVCDPAINPAEAATSGEAAPVDGRLATLGLLDLELALGGEADSTQDGLGEDRESHEALQLTIPQVGRVELASSRSESEIDEDLARTTATAEVLDVDLLDGTITADVLRAKAVARATEFGAGSSIEDSVIEGLRINGEPVEVSRAGETIRIPGVGTLHIMEERESRDLQANPRTASTTVNLLRLELTAEGLDLQGEIIIGHAQAQASFPRNACSEPLNYKVSADAAVVHTQEEILQTETWTARSGPIPTDGGDSSRVVVDTQIPEGEGSFDTGFSQAEGDFDGQTAFGYALAQVQELGLFGGEIVADKVVARTRTEATQDGISSDTSGSLLLNAQIAGTDVCRALGLESLCTPEPNTAFPANIPGVLQIVLNAQSGCAPGDVECNVCMIEVTLGEPNAPTGQICVAEAHSDAQLLAPPADGNTPPEPDLVVLPDSGEAPLDVEFDGSASVDADGDAITEFRFDPGDGSAPIFAATATVSHHYEIEGNYTATLEVRDERGLRSDAAAEVLVTVTAAAGGGNAGGGSGQNPGDGGNGDGANGDAGDGDAGNGNAGNGDTGNGNNGDAGNGDDGNNGDNGNNGEGNQPPPANADVDVDVDVDVDADGGHDGGHEGGQDNGNADSGQDPAGEPGLLGRLLGLVSGGGTAEEQPASPQGTDAQPTPTPAPGAAPPANGGGELEGDSETDTGTEGDTDTDTGSTEGSADDASADAGNDSAAQSGTDSKPETVTAERQNAPNAAPASNGSGGGSGTLDLWMALTALLLLTLRTWQARARV